MFFFFSSRRRHTRYIGDWSSDVCSSDLAGYLLLLDAALYVVDGSPLPEPDEGDGPTAEQLELVSHRHGATEGELDVSEQRYEVMYFVDLADDRIDTFKKVWG